VEVYDSNVVIVDNNNKKLPKHTAMGFNFEVLIAGKLMVKTNHQSDYQFER
jgi:hypothetical protein